MLFIYLLSTVRNSFLGFADNIKFSVEINSTVDCECFQDINGLVTVRLNIIGLNVKLHLLPGCMYKINFAYSIDGSSIESNFVLKINVVGSKNARFC